MISGDSNNKISTLKARLYPFDLVSDASNVCPSSNEGVAYEFGEGMCYISC